MLRSLTSGLLFARGLPMPVKVAAAAIWVVFLCAIPFAARAL